MIELVSSIAILGILSGISIATYQKTRLKVELQQFKEAAELFVPALGNCLTSSQWKVNHPDGIIYPCTTFENIGYTPPKDMEPELTPADLKKKPADAPHLHVNNDDYFCAGFFKKIRGKHYQIHVIVPTDGSGGQNYQVRCKEQTSALALSDSNCIKDATQLCDCKDKKFPQVGHSETCPADPASPNTPGPSAPGPSPPPSSP